VYRVEFSRAAQATIAKIPRDVVQRAEEMLRAMADTADEIDRVAVPLVPADELKLMLHTGGLRFQYLLNLSTKTITVTSITGLRDAVG
jgi:mRNA-degrading endonuclease RelE of RelBE toxin-antitoxin system